MRNLQKRYFRLKGSDASGGVDVTVGTDVQRVGASSMRGAGGEGCWPRPPCNWLPMKPIELELTYTYQWEMMVVLCYLLLRLRESYHQVVLVVVHTLFILLPNDGE